MSTFPSLPGPCGLNRQFTDNNGDPLALGSLEFLITGTSTPKAVYSTALRTVSLGTTLDLDAEGRCDAFFLGSGGYDINLYDADDALVLSFVNVEDTPLTQFNGLGNLLVTGEDDAPDGYTVLPTDNFVSTTVGGTLNLQAAADRTATSYGGMLLTLKNRSATTWAVTPDGADTIEGIAAAFTLPAASSPTFPTIQLGSDGVSNWWIVSSHGL